jgi:hypothetical protein
MEKQHGSDFGGEKRVQTGVKDEKERIEEIGQEGGELRFR